MKKFLLIICCIGSINCFAQTKYQFSLGAGQSFLQSPNMKTGDIGLKFKQDKNVFIDVNKKINDRYKLSIGVIAKVNLGSYWFELNQTIPYYTEREHIPIFGFESVEITPYLKKYLAMHTSENISFGSFINLGLCFNINEGDAYQNTYGLRDDDRDKSFQISVIEEKAQKLYVPYVRITGGVEIFKKMGKNYFLGLSPFITWAGLQSEKNNLTVLPDDPTYISTGSFKRNRSGYGIRVIFSK